MRILIIDEEPNIRRVLECTVEPEHSAVAVGSWAEAWACLEKQDFDIVLLDLHLSGGDGLDLIPLLASHCRCGGVIAYSTSGGQEEALQRGASGYLTQPFTPAELRAELATIVRPRRAEIGGQRVEVGHEWGKLVK